MGDQPQPVLHTVERNLEELRNFISANPELLGDQLLESEKWVLLQFSLKRVLMLIQQVHR